MSRRQLPKQFLALTGHKTLLRETYDRLVSISGPDRIWVISGASHRELVRAQLPELPTENLLGEPVGRNTAPCIGLAAMQIRARDPEALMLVCPSDHIIRPVESFRQAIDAAVSALQAGSASGEPWTVTFGIVPRYPATGFGYIEQGEALSTPRSSVFSVARFKEKPDLQLAEEYLRSGRFYWNSGMFLWKADGLLKLLKSYLPALSAGLDSIGAESKGAGGLDRALAKSFGSLPSISIDYGVLEKAKNVAVVRADFDWDDVGSWRAVERYGSRDSAGNSVLGSHIGVDTRDCIVVGKKKLIATLGVQNLVVVETDDAILVCARDATERVKEIVDRLQKEGQERLV